MKPGYSHMTASTPIVLLGLRERVLTDLEQVEIFSCGVLMRSLTKLEYTCGFGATSMREIREALWIASEDGVPDEAQPEDGDPTLAEVWERAAAIRSENAGAVSRAEVQRKDDGARRAARQVEVALLD